MSVLKGLRSLFASGGKGDKGHVHWEYVRCLRCKEKLAVRVDLESELTLQYESTEGVYYVRKGVLGSGKTRCFQMIEVELYFDAERNLISRYITGGEFITREEFEVQEV